MPFWGYVLARFLAEVHGRIQPACQDTPSLMSQSSFALTLPVKGGPLGACSLRAGTALNWFGLVLRSEATFAASMQDPGKWHGPHAKIFKSTCCRLQAGSCASHTLGRKLTLRGGTCAWQKQWQKPRSYVPNAGRGPCAGDRA